MQFDKTKVYTALNADESLIGAKGYFADDIETLKYKVCNTESIQHYKETFCERLVSDIDDSYNFFYLVEPAQKWYVIQNENGSYSKHKYEAVFQKCLYCGYEKECDDWIAKHSKSKYRPFKDCDELIETYYKKLNHKIDTKLELPTIWVKHKVGNIKVMLERFTPGEVVVSSHGVYDLEGLLDNYTFLDGSVCGVEE